MLVELVVYKPCIARVYLVVIHGTGTTFEKNMSVSVYWRSC